MTTVKIGEKYNSLTVLRYSHSEGNFKYYTCQCDCGNIKNIQIYNLIKGKSKTCGCISIKHGLYSSPEFAAWREIKYRCNTKTSRAYKHYGGRGIRVCERWMESFENFISDMGYRPSDNHSLDRIDNNGHYSCGKCSECINNGWQSNCRWATKRQQMNNTRKTIICEYNGIKKPVSEWAELLGVKRNTIHEGIRTSGKDISFYVNKYKPQLQ